VKDRLVRGQYDRLDKDAMGIHEDCDGGAACGDASEGSSDISKT